MKVKMKSKGDFKQTRYYLSGASESITVEKVQKVAEETVIALANASPYESIATAWSYEIIERKNRISIYFNNSNVQNGLNIALLVDSGHSTRTGKWVAGKNYIAQPIQEAYEKIMKNTKEELRRL